MHANSGAVQTFQGQGEGKGHRGNESAETQLTSRNPQVLTASSITLEECARKPPLHAERGAPPERGMPDVSASMST